MGNFLNSTNYGMDYGNLTLLVNVAAGEEVDAFILPKLEQLLASSRSFSCNIRCDFSLRNSVIVLAVLVRFEDVSSKLNFFFGSGIAS
jgi:hypothetical protein